MRYRLGMIVNLYNANRVIIGFFKQRYSRALDFCCEHYNMRLYPLWYRPRTQFYRRQRLMIIFSFAENGFLKVIY